VTNPLYAPEQPVEPTGPIDVPPNDSEDSVLLKALVLALIAGAATSFILMLLGRFRGLTGKLTTEIYATLNWSYLIRTTAEELASIPRDGTPAARVLQQQATQNAFRRASYLVNASRRMAPALASGDQSMIDVAARREAQYQLAHEGAERQRISASAAVIRAIGDRQPDKNGEILLGWLAHLTARTCPTCLKANRRNFNALVRPRIGYPGEVHGSCECVPRKPWDTDLRVESSAVPLHR
jgi:hypothetical protein